MREYTVVIGDTWNVISKKFGIPVSVLRESNQEIEAVLNSRPYYHFYPGDVITIPETFDPGFIPSDDPIPGPTTPTYKPVANPTTQTKTKANSTAMLFGIAILAGAGIYLYNQK